ncbi:MAG: hypothetical protein WC483_04515 [Candidatus Paceibacterota bacterium]
MSKLKLENSKPNIDEVLARMQRAIVERSKEIAESWKIPSEQLYIIELSYLQGVVDTIKVYEDKNKSVFYNLLHLSRNLLHLLHSKKEDYT